MPAISTATPRNSRNTVANTPAAEASRCLWSYFSSWSIAAKRRRQCLVPATNAENERPSAADTQPSSAGPGPPEGRVELDHGILGASSTRIETIRPPARLLRSTEAEKARPISRSNCLAPRISFHVSSQVNVWRGTSCLDAFSFRSHTNPCRRMLSHFVLSSGRTPTDI